MTRLAAPERNVCRMETDEFNFDDRTKLFVRLSLLHIFFFLYDPIAFGVTRKNGSYGKEHWIGEAGRMGAHECRRIPSGYEF